MKKIIVAKLGKDWYVRVWNADGTLNAQASFSRKKDAERVRESWIAEKTFGEAVKG